VRERRWTRNGSTVTFGPPERCDTVQDRPTIHQPEFRDHHADTPFGAGSRRDGKPGPHPPFSAQFRCSARGSAQSPALAVGFMRRRSGMGPTKISSTSTQAPASLKDARQRPRSGSSWAGTGRLKAQAGPSDPQRLQTRSRRSPCGETWKVAPGRQYRMRGRRGRPWTASTVEGSPIVAVYASFEFRMPDVPRRQLGRFDFARATAV
jgi:hypothetical protein